MKKKETVAGFLIPEYRNEKSRHGFLKEDQEGEEIGVSSSFSWYGSKKPSRDFWLGYSRTKMPRHYLSWVSSSLCLRVSSLVLQAGGKILISII
jgi:hypothetical protein